MENKTCIMFFCFKDNYEVSIIKDTTGQIITFRDKEAALKEYKKKKQLYRVKKK